MKQVGCLTAIILLSLSVFTGCKKKDSTTAQVTRTTKILASSLNSPNNIIVDGSAVYWADFNDGSIKTTNKNGNATVITLGQSFTYTIGFDLAQDDAFIYYTEDGGDVTSVRKVPKAGGAVTVLADTGTAYPGSSPGFLDYVSPSGIVTTTFDGNIFFGDRRGLLSMTKTGTNLKFVYDAGASGVERIVCADQANIYFAGFAVSNVNIVGVPFKGGTPTTVVSNVDQVIAINTPTEGKGQGSIFYIEMGSMTLKRQTTSGGTPVTLAKDVWASVTANCLAVDNDYVYFPYSNQVAKVPIEGGSVTVLAKTSDANGVAAITVDDKYVYWTSTGSGNGNGSVRRVEK